MKHLLCDTAQHQQSPHSSVTGWSPAAGKGGTTQSSLLCMLAWTGLLPPTFLWAQPPATPCCTFVVISLIGCKKTVLNMDRVSRDFVLRFPLQENLEGSSSGPDSLWMQLCSKRNHHLPVLLKESTKDFMCKTGSGSLVLHICQERLFSPKITWRIWNFPTDWQAIPCYGHHRSLRRKPRTTRGKQCWLLDCS